MQPIAFADIFGHARAVEALRARMRARKHHPGLILHGPPGVGRRTLARVYARGASCDRPTAEGERCGKCEECRAFGSDGSSLGCFEYAPREMATASDMDQVLETRHGSLAKRSVITLVGSDEYAPRLLDRFLKTLEEPAVTFVFLAGDEARLPPPIRSRCVGLRLRPLPPAEAEAFLCARLDPSVGWDAHALDVLIAAGEGLPGRMAEHATALPGKTEITLDVVRHALGLAWSEEMSAFWRDRLAAGTSSDAVLGLPGSAEPGELVRQMRSFLRHLQGVGSPGSASDPAFLHREADLLVEPIARLRGCAYRCNRSPAAVWAAIAHVWMSGDLTDNGAVVAAVEETRRILSGHAAVR